MRNEQGCHDVIVIGAGPSGSVAAALLQQKGHRVLILEQQHFPRFSIGESLLPQCMAFLEEAGMLDTVTEAGFQFKNGAAFTCGDRYDAFDFTEKFSEGWGTTFQVQRGTFDKLLADRAESQGVEIRYGHRVEAFQEDEIQPQLTVVDEGGERYRVDAKLVLDASGFGRVLPRLLDLDQPSSFPSRTSLFTHVEDRICDPRFDRNKILITVHPTDPEIWYWLIPFSNGRSSVGVVLPQSDLQDSEEERKKRLLSLISEGGLLAEVLADANVDSEIGMIEGYSCDVKQQHGPGYALLGNAGEFLDPVFSSGVTIALKSASLAAAVADRQLRGVTANWHDDFAVPLKQGVDTFRSFVEAWYDQRLQQVIFSSQRSKTVKEMISAVLAGYAWDNDNPFVRDSDQRLTTLAELCKTV